MRRHLSYANVMATLAFFVAVGGVGYAAATIDSGDVVNESLKSKDLKNNKAVKGPDVPPNALTGEDIDEDSLVSVDANSLWGYPGGDFARGSGRRQSVSFGQSSQPVVTSDAAGTFQLLCNDPDVENSELRFFAPSPSVNGAGDRDSWVTVDAEAPTYKDVVSDGTDNHSVELDPSLSANHRVVWQISPHAGSPGEVVTAIFSFHQADATSAPCDILGQTTVLVEA